MILTWMQLSLGWSAVTTAQNPANIFQRESTTRASFVNLDRYRIRVVWGGGTPIAWQGSLVLSDGRFENITALGLEPDAGAALQVTGNKLQIRPTRSSDFNGFDVEVVGCRGHQITLKLLSPDQDQGVQHQIIDLSPLLQRVTQSAGLQVALDESGNRIDINRAPGDRIPVSINREHLVFDPGETLELGIEPFAGIDEAGTNAKLHVDLVPSGQTRSKFNEQYPLDWNGQRYSRREPILIELPEQEGVYDIRLTLKDESLAGRLTLNRETLSRTVQVVVVDRGAFERPATAEQVVLWSEVFNSEDVRNQWIDRIPGVPQIRMASSGSRSESLRNSGVGPQIIDGKTWNSFAPGGWQAIPLEVDELDKPHIVEIEYLDDGPMAIGISVLQPERNGQVEPFGVDSGITIPETANHAESTVRRHRIFFWPQHKAPYLLFANRHDSRSARIGAIRVLSGPERLATSDYPYLADEVKSRRKYMAFYEKPLFVENFSGARAVDEDAGHTWHDWNSFLTGADRWAQYLKANGYNSAMLVVAGDGSSFYPSRLLQPNTRFDSGALSPNGSDPVRKDVVELLLRVFQREGLQLVPVFHFNSPLPALEQQRISGSPNADGILLVDAQGESRLKTLETDTSPVSIYNPLDRRVQQAHSGVIREFTTRYQNRESFAAFGGLGILYTRDALQVMPGQTWGVDRNTLAQFVADTGFRIPESNDWLDSLLGATEPSPWLTWRQSRMALWLNDIQQSVGSNQRIYLLGGDMFEMQDAFSVLAPSLRRNGGLNEAMARIAFPMQQVAASEDMVFLQPAELAPEQSLAQNRLNIQLDQTADGQDVFREFVNSGKLFSHQCSWAEFEQLRQQKLFGEPQQGPLIRLQPLAPAGHWNRQRLARSLADSDSQTLVEGGWITGFGQEEHLAEFIETFTRLPDIRFNDVSANEDQPQTGVVVRQAMADERNWFYAVNPTPWKLTAAIQLSGRNTIIESIGRELVFDQHSDQPQMIVELEPFSLQAGSLDATVSVTGFQVDLPDTVTSELQDQLNSLLTKVSRAAQAEPIQVLQNPGFEPVDQTDNGSQGFGWFYDNRSGDAISLRQSDTAEGSSSLTMVSRGSPTWIRSNEFPAPTTGRLSVSVAIRTENPQVQPPLRISIQGNDGRQVYYRYGIVGGDSRKITSEWQDFTVHFDDLPLEGDGNLQVGFDLMGTGQVDIDRVQVFDRWLDGQDSRSLTQLLALAGFQLNNKKNIDRCRRILEGYWPRFLNEFFPDENPDAIIAEEPRHRTRSSRRLEPGDTGSNR